VHEIDFIDSKRRSFE